MVVSDQFVLCKAALIFAVTRWLLSFTLNLLTTSINLFSSSSSSSSDPNNSQQNSSSNLKLVRENLSLTTLVQIEHNLPENCDRSCAVCLNKLKKKSQIWELRNCNHVFHKHCLEKWVAYDNRLTCPLCRATLLTLSAPAPPPQEPSWAVERMLYFFGDDLLP